MALGMTVAELHQRVDAREFAEWMAFDRIEPFGDRRADLRSATVAATIANCHRGRSSSRIYPRDFMPDFDREPQTDADMEAALFHYARLRNETLAAKGGR